jgi:predicted  nucleic acid-binding Zn-ribbon protein
VKASLKQLAALRRIGHMVDALSLQSRAFHRACETAREYRQRLTLRLEELARYVRSHQLEDLARRFPEEHGQRLAEARAEIEQIEGQIAESKAEEETIRARSAELAQFIGTNQDRLDEALETLRLSRADVGAPWGERDELSTVVAI